MTSGITRGTAELSIINGFIKGYKALLGIDLVVVSHRDKPDFEVQNTQTGEKLGVEVTGLYQNAREAKIQYDREPDWDSFSGSLDDLIANLNTLLAEKAGKAKDYQYTGKMLLAIYIGSLVYNEIQDFRYIDSRIRMPENRFFEIWLILRDNTGQETELKALKRSPV